MKGHAQDEKTEMVKRTAKSGGVGTTYDKKETEGKGERTIENMKGEGRRRGRGGKLFDIGGGRFSHDDDDTRIRPIAHTSGTVTTRQYCQDCNSRRVDVKGGTQEGGEGVVRKGERDEGRTEGSSIQPESAQCEDPGAAS